MASTENSKLNGQTANQLSSVELAKILPGNIPPLSLLTPEQQVKFRMQAEICYYSLGEKIWSTDRPGDQFLIVSGKVRLREEGVAKPLTTLTEGDWFGDLQQFLGFKAIASTKEVVVVRWDTALWNEASSPELDSFWKQSSGVKSSGEEARIETERRISVSNYPFVSNPNSGAACLTMVAQHLQNPASLEWIQRQLRGQRPRHLVEASEKLGLHLRRLVVYGRELQQLSLPALLYWNQEHWVVVYEVKGDRVIIANPLNPSQTCERISLPSLEAAWDGQLWQVEPIQRQDKFNLSWFLPAVWRYRGLLGEVLVASFTLQLLGLATPIITQVIIDKVMVQESLPTLDVMAIALLGVAIFEAILGILRLFIFTHTARRLDLSLSAQLFRHLMRLPLAYFESRRVGDTVARVQELENIRQFLTGTALTVILDSVFAVVYLALMFYYNVKLTFVALAVIPLFAMLTLVATPILRNWLNETFNRSADSQSFLVETVTGIHAVKAHAAERTARDRWEGLFARFIRTGFKASTTSNISNNIGDFLTNFSNLLILWFGAALVIDHQLTIGQLVAFQMLAGRMTGPILRLVGLRHFLAPLAAENLSEQGKEVNDQKMPETLVNTGFMLFRAESPSLSRFEAIFLSVFV
jgi:ATP-binding cassette subfamily B protein